MTLVEDMPCMRHISQVLTECKSQGGWTKFSEKRKQQSKNCFCFQRCLQSKRRDRISYKNARQKVANDGLCSAFSSS